MGRAGQAHELNPVQDQQDALLKSARAESLFSFKISQRVFRRIRPPRTASSMPDRQSFRLNQPMKQLQGLQGL